MKNTKILLLASALVLLSTTAQASVPSACNPCLWYAGDFDPGNPIAATVVNTNSPWEPLKAQIWVPFIPASDGNPLHKHVLPDVFSVNC